MRWVLGLPAPHASFRSQVLAYANLPSLQLLSILEQEFKKEMSAIKDTH